MARRRLNKLTAPTPMRDYGRGLHALAQENAAAIELMLPDGVADIDALASLCEGVLASHTLWLELSRDRDLARSRCDGAAAAASTLYGQFRGYAQLTARKLKDDGEIAALLQRCPAPSDLKADDLPAAMRHLRDGIAAYPASFPRLSADTARLEAFDAARETLVSALAAYSDADRGRTRASNQRDQSRADLLVQIRVIELALKRALTAEEYKQVATLRAHHLPLASSPEPSSTETG